MRILILALTALTALTAQTKSSDFQVIPTRPDATGTIKWLEKRANGVHSFAWSASDAMAADVVMKWPNDGAAGFLYSDGAGNTNWTGGGTCGVDCMSLTTNQTAAGIKTFQNGLILEGTTTAQNFNVLPTYSFDVGTPGAINISMQGGLASWTNGSGIQRVLISQGGGASTVSGIVRTSNATDTINSMDSDGVFSAVGFNVGTFAGQIPIVDAAGLVTPVSFQLTAGATNGFCLVSDAAGVGTWQACSAGGSFVTTNTNQTTLTGTKEWNSAHTHNASILSGTHNTNNIGDTLTAFANMYSLNMQPVNLEIYNSSRSAFWRTNVPAADTYRIDSGSGAQTELQLTVISPTSSSWLMRGSLFPADKAGSNGDIGSSSVNTFKWRSGYFTGSLNANTGVFSGTTPSVTVGTQSVSSNGSFIGYDSGVSVQKVLLSWSGSGGGIIRTQSNTGTEQNSIDGVDGVRSNVGFAVGTAASPTQVIDNLGFATLLGVNVAVGAVNGYVWTSDSIGTGSWQPPASGSFVTTNTNQTGLSGTKAWTNLQTYNGGVEVKLASTARNWNPESDAAYVLGSGAARWLSGNFSSSAIIGDGGTGARLELFSTTGGYYSASNVQKVLFAAGGSGTGIVRVFNSSGVVQAAMDSTGFDTPNAYLVSGTQVITSGRTGLFPQIGTTSNHNSTFYGETVNVYGTGLTDVCGGGSIFATGLNFYSTTGLGCFPIITFGVAGSTGVLSVAGSVTTNTLTINTGAATVGHVWTATSTGGAGSWQAAGGGGSNITTNTTQSGLTGDKQTSGQWTWGTSGGQSAIIPGNGANFTLYSTSFANKVLLSNGGAGTGLVRTFNSSGIQTNGMDSSGLSTTLGIVVNGSGGLSLTCGVGQTVRQPVYVFGVLTSGICGL